MNPAWSASGLKTLSPCKLGPDAGTGRDFLLPPVRAGIMSRKTASKVARVLRTLLRMRRDMGRDTFSAGRMSALQRLKQGSALLFVYVGP